MIETGVESGYSTEHFLVAMDDIGSGHLYSCDPAPTPFYQANPIIHPRFTFIQKRSQDCLQALFDQHGPFDIFLHDSDHSWECQTWEYEFAWGHVRSGGIIATDDPAWGMIVPVFGAIAHGAWAQFCRRHGMENARNKINNAEWIRKP